MTETINYEDKIYGSVARKIIESLTPAEMKHRPVVGRKYSYKGRDPYYTVIGFANWWSETEKHQPQVIYKGENGLVWSRDLNSWFEAFENLAEFSLEQYSWQDDREIFALSRNNSRLRREEDDTGEN